MPAFHALVDAVPGKEDIVESGIRDLAAVTGLARCRYESFDFLLRFEAEAFSNVDEFLQTHVRRLPGVKEVQAIIDWADFPALVRAARDRLL